MVSIPAATSSVSIPILSNTMASSFMNAMLISLWLFSATLMASAALMDETLYVPAAMTMSYTSAITSSDSRSIPETIFVMFSSLCFLSPGLIRSGEYPTLKSLPADRPDSLSRIGIHTSSVTPGYTVDSNTTTEPLLRLRPTIVPARMTGDKSGVWSWFTGVGTAIM